MTATRRVALLGAAAVGVLLVVALVVVAGRGSPPGGSVALEVTGRAVLTENGGSRTVASGRYRVAEGTTVEVVEGVAVATMGDGARLELREGFGGAVDSRALIQRPVVLLAGDLLVEAGDGAVTVEAAGTIVRVGGAGRVSRFAAVTAALYEGDGGVESVDRRLEVPALRQAVVPDLGLVPARAEPLVYDERDPWDRRFLGAAMRLTDELDARSRGFTAQLAAEGRAALGDHVARLTAGTAATFSGLLDAERPPGETIVGAAIAAETGDAARAWSAVFSFRDEGAAWGLVALDQGVDRERLLARLDGAIAEAPLLFAAPGTPASRRTGPPPAPPTTEPAPLPPPAPPGGGAGPPPPSPAPPAPPDDEPTPVDPVLDPVLEAVDEVTELLGGLLGGGADDDRGLLDPGGLIDDVVGTVGGLLGGAGAAVGGALTGPPGGR